MFLIELYIMHASTLQLSLVKFKNTIKIKNYPFKNIELLNKTIAEKEAIIKDCLEKNRIVFSEIEIRKQYDESEDLYIIPTINNIIVNIPAIINEI